MPLRCFNPKPVRVWRIKSLTNVYAHLFVDSEDFREILRFNTVGGAPVESWEPLPVVVAPASAVLGYPLGDFIALDGLPGTPVVTTRTLDLLRPLLQGQVQPLLLPFAGHEPLFYLNVLNNLDCIDYQRSKIVMAETVKAIKRIPHLVLKANCVRGHDIFLLKDYPPDFYVSDAFKQVVEQNALVGIEFIPVATA